MDTKDVATLVLSLVAALIGVSNWRAAWFRSRLKDDLDILRRYREEFASGSVSEELAGDASYTYLRAKIRRRMVQAYVLRGTSGRIAAGVGFLALAIALWLLAGDAWSAKPTWRLALPAAPVVAAGGFFWEAFEDRNKARPLKAPQSGL
jgi:hypothetical protein